MADPRRYIGVRISEQGHFYIKLVAERDRINYSEALRRLLALGAKTDMEAHGEHIRPDGHPRAAGDGAGSSDRVHQVGEDGDGHRYQDGDGHSAGVLRLSDGTGRPANVGDAIGALVLGGLNPSQADEDDGPSAA